jgi:uncharacterized membrane protein
LHRLNQEDSLILILAFLIGIIAGLRALMAPAIASWGAGLGWFSLDGTPLHFMSSAITRWIFTIAEIGEIINDKLPQTPSRKVPPQFIARVLMGGLAGATLGAAHDSLLGGLIAGVFGAVAGTYGGAAVRGALAKAFGRDLPAALLEDAVALLGAIFIVSRV